MNEAEIRDLIRAQYVKPESLPSGIWDSALNSEVRLEWLVNAFPTLPRNDLEKLATQRWFQAGAQRAGIYYEKR